MFSSALKSFSSNITSNYSIAATPTFVSGPWKIYDGKQRTSGKTGSVFVFDRKSLEPPGGAGLGGRNSASSLKRAHDEIVERLKKEAGSLARLRHPNILELTEPVEDTRNGGLMFATEPVTASLAGLLDERNGQEKQGGIGGRNSKYVIEDADGVRRRREIEIDELEIQKGLLQIGKGLEFLHGSAKLVHCNLTPEAIYVNAKSDWKISGLGFSSPPDQSSGPSSVTPISLSEVLNYDARLPRSVQLNLDYSSPDFVLDTNITTSADMFSLGLIVIALYNSPHRSPVETGCSVTNYRRIFSSPSTTPTANNNYLCAGNLSKEILASLLPRLLTRRPAQRYSAREFQQARFFDNILVSTIGFLDTFPARSPSEKSQFLRGLPRVLPQFPKAVLEKKILPVLLEETQDPELLSLLLQNVFLVIGMTANSQRTLSELVIPRLKQVFLSGSRGKAQSKERDPLREGGLRIVLENVNLIASNCTGRIFKEDVLPIIYYAMESPTHSIVDSSLQTMQFVLPSLDFSLVKNELFPAVANVFTKTSSLAIKVRGLEAFHILCGGQVSGSDVSTATDKSGILDKYTVQEKVIPLLRGIKTKEPAVMMAALNVFRQATQVADSDYCAMDILPLLWQFSLGPLLNLEQFQSFMILIKSLSARIEREQTRKLQELSANGTSTSTFVGNNQVNGGSSSNGQTEESDFETLVSGRRTGETVDFIDDSWDHLGPAIRPSSLRMAPHRTTAGIPSFSWSSASPNKSSAQAMQTAIRLDNAGSRAITPDNAISSFTTLTPSSAPVMASTSAAARFSKPLHPSQAMPSNTTNHQTLPSVARTEGIDWTAAAKSSYTSSNSSSMFAGASLMSPVTIQPLNTTINGSASANALTNIGSYRIPPPLAENTLSNSVTGQNHGLDKYESLI